MSILSILKAIILLITLSIISSSNFLIKNDIKVGGNTSTNLLLMEQNLKIYLLFSYTNDKNNIKTLKDNTYVTYIPVPEEVYVVNEFKEKVTAVNDGFKLKINNRFALKIKDQIDDEEEQKKVIGVFLDGGYILESYLGIPRTGYWSVLDKPDPIIKQSDKVEDEDKVTDNDGNLVYIFSRDWTLSSTYIRDFTDILPLEVPNAELIFKDNKDFYIKSSFEISCGRNINPSHLSVTKSDPSNKYIASYYGFPLYISKDGNDINDKQANGGKYFSINYDGTINSKRRRIKIYSFDFEQLLTESNYDINSSSVFVGSVFSMFVLFYFLII